MRKDLQLCGSISLLLLLFKDFSISENLLKLFTFYSALDDVSLSILGDDSNLEFVGRRDVHVHGLAEDFRCEDECIVERAIFLVVVLECADRVDTVLASGMGFPGSVVAGGVGVIQLETGHSVVASVHERDAEWSARAKLSVAVLVVCQLLHERFNVDWRRLAEQVSLSIDAAHINQVIRISNHA